MLRTVGEGIKAVDPGAKVVTAGLNESELGIKLVPFLNGMYRAARRAASTCWRSTRTRRGPISSWRR